MTQYQESDDLSYTHLSLQEALRVWKEVFGLGNSYAWYRGVARGGRVPLGHGIDLPVFKERGKWKVRSDDLARCQDACRRYGEHVREVSEDYEAGVLHEGAQTLTWGGYRNNGLFHFVWNDYQVYRRRSDGSWRCNTCFKFIEKVDGVLKCISCGERVEMHK